MTFFLFVFQEPPRLEKSPLLANGYNHPPTHINPMQFMQLNHPAAAHTAILSPAGMQHPGLQRPDGNLMKNQIPGMEAIARYVIIYVIYLFISFHLLYD